MSETGQEHGGSHGQKYREDFSFRLIGSFRDSLSRQAGEAVRLELVELLGSVLGDKGDGVGSKTVKILKRRGEYFQSMIVKHVFYQQ